MLSRIIERLMKRLSRFEVPALLPQAEPVEELYVELAGGHILQVNRNARWPKQANHGSRPNSSVMRRLKKQGLWKPWKEELALEGEEANPRDIMPDALDEETMAAAQAAEQAMEDEAKSAEDGEGDGEKKKAPPKKESDDDGDDDGGKKKK